MLRYDRRLDGKPDEKILVVAHETGHLCLHKRLSDPSIPPDPLLGSAYMGSGAPGVARYSEKAREEAEANAFAAEFLCPAADALAEWRAGASAQEIARRRGIPLRVVHAQLAQGLHQHGTAVEGGHEAGKGGGFAMTDRQEAAATEIGRPVLVDAGPGTGKTRTLVRRTEFLLGLPDVRPEQLLVLTFTNEAAEELRWRAAVQFGDDVAERMEITTFHAWGYVFLHHFAHALGMESELTLLDDAAQAELVIAVLASVECDAILDLKDPDKTARELVRYIGFLKDRLWTPDDLERELAAWSPEPEDDTRAKTTALLAVYRAYEAEKKRRSAVDYGDLILLPIRILTADPELRAKLAAKHRWVMVDEYQDVSAAVAALLRQICDETNPPWVVGDSRQAIYRFRGAHPENVDDFPRDFAGASRHELDVNFRSGSAVVSTANHLAALLRSSDFEGDVPSLWSANVDRPAGRGPAVAIAEANSDAAEREGIAAQVRAWIDEGVAPADIAVLARRNIDVRHISLALNQLGVRAVTSGVVTAEGAAGDLAAVVALLDAPRAAVPRLAYALFRRSTPRSALNAAIRRILETMRPNGTFDTAPVAGAGGVVEEIARLRDALEPFRFSADGWEILCAFLFGNGTYLREILERADDAEAGLAVEEIVTALSMAAAHRYTHPGLEPWRSRIGFGQRLRSALAQATPPLAPPPARRDAVRVMTCHASKGLEFPYVVVAGQTLSGMRSDHTWLPPEMCPHPEDDARQADSLLFVGVTRAQRAVVVSFARSASGTDRPDHQRDRPLLLERWAEQAGVPRLPWEVDRAAAESFSATALWGGEYPAQVPASVLSSGGCSIRTYLQRNLAAQFPTAGEGLWPMYVGVTRRAMQRIVRTANHERRPVTPGEAIAILDEEWEDVHGREHPLLPLYRKRAERRVLRLASAYVPEDVAEELPLELVLSTAGGERVVRTDLLAHFRVAGGGRRVIGFEKDPLDVKLKNGGINWGDLDKGKLQVPFSLLQTAAEGDLELAVFSEADGRIHTARWSIQKPSMVKARAGAEDQVRRGIAGEVETKIKSFTCGTCPHRVHCPHWMRASDDLE
jgi:superfamily I DNA/RNA helicase